MYNTYLENMRKKLLFCFLALVIALLIYPPNLIKAEPSIPSVSTSRSNPFLPIPEVLRPRINFWKDVFTKYSVHSYALHDRKHVHIVYEVVNVARILKTTKYSRRQKYRVIDKFRKKYKQILNTLHKTQGNTAGLSDDIKRVAKMFEGIPGKNKFRTASQGVRAQAGLKEKFIKGLERQEKYISKMRKIFREANIPEEILALPHIESSFNPRARSRVGATGIWQFTRSTGRLYLKINRRVDQRKDPYLSTKAVAKLFRNSYRKLGSWPLAVMAHNHGANGIARAKRRLNTSKPEIIIQKYSSRSFRFASRNFYPEFLAALEISDSPWTYFPAHTLPASLRGGSRRTSDYLAYSVSETKDRQPEKTDNFVEKNINKEVKKPQSAAKRKTAKNRIVRTESVEPDDGIVKSINNLVGVSKAVAKDAKSEPRLSVKHDKSGKQFWIQAYPGESIWNYMEWSGVTVNKLRKVNNISRRKKIRPGMSINIPIPASQAEGFEQKRREYHKTIEDAYYSKYSVSGTVKHKVKRGENMWYLCNRIYDIPFWLLQKYNSAKIFYKLKIGDVLIIPVVTRTT